MSNFDNNDYDEYDKEYEREQIEYAKKHMEITPAMLDHIWDLCKAGKDKPTFDELYQWKIEDFVRREREKREEERKRIAEECAKLQELNKYDLDIEKVMRLVVADQKKFEEVATYYKHNQDWVYSVINSQYDPSYGYEEEEGFRLYFENGKVADYCCFVDDGLSYVRIKHFFVPDEIKYFEEISPRKIMLTAITQLIDDGILAIGPEEISEE